MTKDEAYQQYEETLAKIDKQAHDAREEARAILQGRLKAIRDSLHKELKSVRAISQKTKRGSK